jgi:hypothetical protein
LRIADLLPIVESRIADLLPIIESPIADLSGDSTTHKSAVGRSQQISNSQSPINPQSQNPPIVNKSAIRNPQSAI